MRAWYLTARRIAGNDKNCVEEPSSLRFSQRKSVLGAEDSAWTAAGVGTSPWNLFRPVLSWVEGILDDAQEIGNADKALMINLN